MCLPWRSGSLKHPVVRWYFACERKKVTGFSNEEEKLAELDKYVPFLTETELVDRGVLYQKAAEPWGQYSLWKTKGLSVDKARHLAAQLLNYY